MTTIGKNAFNGCKLRNVLVKRNTPPNAEDYFVSTKTFYHTTLYIPTGSWDAYAYDNKWYQFINIRETAMTEEQLNTQQVYTLMNANTFTYSVYDPVNDCINAISSVGIDENNPNHNWQVIDFNGSRCLYNIGAKKFVKSVNGSLVLSGFPIPIEMKNGDNGIIIGEQTSKQWALVNNESMNVEQAIITGIDEISTDLQNSNILYDLNGRKLSSPQKGINIIRMSDGTTRKMMIK